MAGYWELRGDAQVWPGVVNRGYVTDFEFQEGSFLADYAKAGKWAKVLEMLRPENHLVNVNQCWPGDGSRSTVLHRAAELDAPEHVVAALLERGALRSLRNAQGHTAHEIASEAGQPVCNADALRPVPSPFGTQDLAELDTVVAEVIDRYIQPIFGGHDLRRILRYPPVEVLHEAPAQQLWMQVPLMMGGFRIMLTDGHVELLGANRRFDDSGEAHVRSHRFLVTPAGWTLIGATGG